MTTRAGLAVSSFLNSVDKKATSCVTPSGEGCKAEWGWGGSCSRSGRCGGVAVAQTNGGICGELKFITVDSLKDIENKHSSIYCIYKRFDANYCLIVMKKGIYQSIEVIIPY